MSIDADQEAIEKLADQLVVEYRENLQAWNREELNEEELELLDNEDKLREFAIADAEKIHSNGIYSIYTRADI